MKSNARIIVGLGNPGPEYDGTRHNIGFRVVDALATKIGVSFSRDAKLAAYVAEGFLHEEKVILVKPTTYMNASGDAVRFVLARFHEDARSLVVIADDVALPLGTVRIRRDSGAGGHNGVKSIIARLGSQEFLRMKLGVGSPPARMPLEAFVLQRFRPEERGEVDGMVDAAVEILLTQGVLAETTVTVGEAKRTE